MSILSARKTLFATIGSVLLFSCTTTNKPETQSSFYTGYVDPLIGSSYHGHVFVGASVPFGAVQLGPVNPTQGWDWCSGYHYSDENIVGFAHTHLSGTGIGDLGDILFMPVNETYKPSNDQTKPFDWVSSYSHSTESVKPGYYSVHVDRYKVDVELAATERVGFHKYTYTSGAPMLIIDLVHGTGWDRMTEAKVEQVDDKTIRGYRFSTGWATDQRVFFTTEFSKKIKFVSNIKTVDSNEKVNPENTTVMIGFEGDGELLAKTAISPVSTDGALANLKTELDHWDFNAAVASAKEKWESELGKIKIETNNTETKRTFYTALYHTMIAPSLFNDATGDYRGADRQVKPNPGFKTYTTLSLWDTYRAAHPLYTLFQPEKVNDFVNTMLAIYKEQGKLPVWHLMGCETNTMVGYHAVPVIVDAYLKGFTGFDAGLAFEAVKASAMRDESGLAAIKQIGYIPAESEVESVAKALEYAIDDWCIAAMAQKMGKTEDAEYFSKRAKYYQHYFDTTTRFMRGKMGDGSWRTPFDPISSQHRADDYCEGNAWQYTWLVPQDVEGLMALLGGEETFIAKLDSLFTIESIKVEGASADISGLIGQYAHGNEPSHHIPYIYTYAGQQWKSAEKVRQIMKQMYTDKPDGLCGNEDCGQMSAWYVLSSMGIYPVNPANGAYVFGSPLFDKMELTLPGGKTFTIIAENNSETNIYIQSVELNGVSYTKSFITHKDILSGGTLKFTMGSLPNKEFGKAEADRPKSIVY